MPFNPARIRRALHDAVDQSRAPGAVLYVGDLDTEHFFEATGSRQLFPYTRALRRDTLFDLASLTKVIATATAVMKLRDAGKFQLTDSIADHVPIPEFRAMTIENLLTHTAGLVAHKRYFETETTVDGMLNRFAKEGIETPPNIRHEYSDAGFMLLGKLVELSARDTLDAYCTREIFEPLGMTRTAFRPPEAWRGNCAATEDDPWRGRLLVGEVHDENAAAVGGVSGQAGVFSTAEDIALFCRSLLRGEVLPAATVDEMLRFDRMPVYPWQGLAWELDPWSSKKSGFLPSRAAFGHTGFVGTSLWMDRASGLFVILLSNTVHPTRINRGSETLRRVIHQAVAEEFFPTTSNTHTGLDRLIRENYRAIEGKRIALLTNHSAVDERGKHILDTLVYAKDTTLKTIYTPEHGLHGQAEAGEKVAGQTASVPVVSLYGEKKEPSREELKGVDLFVVDLQDVGARFYTYPATMRACLAACAAARVPVLVLDRPNPLGGSVVEGPIAMETNSLVSAAAVPIRHGMTLGELAMWFQRYDPKVRGLNLRVNWLDNWPPARLFGACALPWVPPSPNLPTPNTALLYAGMCLFEGTNLNEGRGTDTPFGIVGAPWLNAQAVVDRVSAADCEGAELEAVYYVPKSIPGKAASPRYQDETCQGIRVRVVRPEALRPFTVAVALLVALRETHPNEFALDGSPPFDLLAGGPDLRTRIEAGQRAADIVQMYAAGLATYEAERPRLYDATGVPLEVLAQASGAAA